MKEETMEEEEIMVVVEDTEAEEIMIGVEDTIEIKEVLLLLVQSII